MTSDYDRLLRQLRRIDGRSYPAYRDIKGSYQLGGFHLDVLHVQGDPFAAPSRLQVRVPLEAVGLSAEAIADPARRTGLEDALLRAFTRALNTVPSKGRRGSGKSGAWGVHAPSQQMLPRTACELSPQGLALRFTAGLPAQGRRVLGRQAAAMLTEELPEVIHRGVFDADPDTLKRHADAYEDQEVLRDLLVDRGWIGFIADGAILPRRSGVDDRPMAADQATAWRSPDGVAATVTLPHAGEVRGTAIAEGVTLICGGGYHGKSTVLRALAHAVYNHIPGDGRELCSAVYDAVHVRAEDGRRVSGVDISMFIGDLPDGRSTEDFTSDNASGSTSQAANIVEALEVGARCLLIDEDTSATNFMVRDRRMQELIAVEREPITPFVDRVAELHARLGVSTLIVVGGAGDYFEVADAVLLMDGYVPKLVTERAHAIAERYPSQRLNERRRAVAQPRDRVPHPSSFNPRQGKRGRERARARRTDHITLGEEEIDVSLVSQLIDPGQARALADWLLACSRGLADDARTLNAICDRLEDQAWDGHLSDVCAEGFGDRVMPRRFELAAAVNRLRSLRVRAAQQRA